MRHPILQSCFNTTPILIESCDNPLPILIQSRLIVYYQAIQYQSIQSSYNQARKKKLKKMCLSLKNTTKPSQFSCVLFSSSSSNQPPHLNQAVYVKIKDWYVWTLGIYILLIFGPVCVDSSLENIDIASFFKIISNPICLPIFSFIFPFSVFFFHFFAQVQLFSCLLVWSLKPNLSLIQETTLYFWLCLAAYFWPIFSLLFSLLDSFAASKKGKNKSTVLPPFWSNIIYHFRP